MSAEAALLARSWHVGRFRCELTMQRPRVGGVAQVVIEWWPQEPRRLSAAEMSQYRAGRDAALIEVAAAMGGSIAVIEL